MASAQALLAVDIGGTFTDVVLEAGERRFTTKVLTTSAGPERGVLDGIAIVLRESGLAPGDIRLFIHGTTLATNALIERKGARTAFLTTEGFRDILEMAYEKRFAHYDVQIEMPQPLVPRPLRLPIRERVSARGEVLVPLDEASVHAVVETLERERVEAVAVGFLHGYAHAAHEQRVRAIVSKALPGVTVCLASEVCPEIREYERFSTTCANAYVRPLIAGYLGRLRARLDAIGLAAPLFLITSGGGLTTLENARRFPVRLVESGPAGGVILGARMAREAGLDHVLAFDMGGTTAKICLIDDYEPERARRFEAARTYRDLKGSGLPVRIPVIELVEIGAGGGSIARVDAMGRIAVGPDSAGAEPGPACYARGGAKPTVTDANLALGRIDPAHFAGGRIALDAARAEQALVEQVGARVDLDGAWAAAGISEIVEENMANAARVHAIERGKVIDRYTMIAFGGGAPLHAGRLAEKLGVKRVIVPVGAGVGSAIGFLRAPISYEVVRSRRVALGALDLAAANWLVDSLRNEARAVVQPGAAGAALVESRLVDLRYVGQGHELTIALPHRALTHDDIAALRRQFEERYGRIYGVTLSDMEVEIVTWSVTVSTEAEQITPAAEAKRLPAAPSSASRRVWEPALGRHVEMAVYRRADLAAGAEFAGPALVVEDETTTVVPASFTAHIDARGHIVLESRPGDS